MGNNITTASALIIIKVTCLTLSARTEYMYSTVSHASCPDGVLVLCDIHKVVK
jgi:hypothetical protein